MVVARLISLLFGGRAGFYVRRCQRPTLGLTRFDGHPSSGVCPRKDVRSSRAWGRSPGGRRSFTPEFKAEIVELCQRGDRSARQVAKDFDLTETAVREWVKQAERDAGILCRSNTRLRG